MSTEASQVEKIPIIDPGENSHKLTDQAFLHEVYNHFNMGVSISGVCRLVGLSVRKFNSWMEEGERGVEPYATFYRVVNYGQGKSELRSVNTITQAVQGGDVASAKWFLSRARGDDWESKTRVTGGDGGAVKIEAAATVIDPERASDIWQTFENDEAD